MPLELGLWRVYGEPVRLTQSGIPLEKTLENLVERDPDVLGKPLLIIGRQVPTAHGKFLTSSGPAAGLSIGRGTCALKVTAAS